MIRGSGLVPCSNWDLKTRDSKPMRPLQAYDAGGRARAFTAMIKAMAEAKDAGIDTEQALKLVDWQE